MLKGALFFVSFFLIFASTVYLIPTPMFPGNVVLSLANASTLPQASFLMALINGITYGLISWAVFAVAMRKIGGGESSGSDEGQVERQGQNRVDSRGKRSRRSRR